MNTKIISKLLEKGAKFAKPVKEFAVENAPEILTGIGIASGISALIFTNKATVKATLKVEQMKREGKDTSPKEVIKETWKYYIPGTVSEVTSVACLVGGASKGRAARTMLAATCDGLQTACNEWKAATKEIVPEKYDEIQTNAQEKIHKKVNTETYVKPTLNGNDIFYDARTGQYFKSSRKFIESCVNSANSVLNEKARSICSDGHDPEDWYGVDELIEMFGENYSDLARGFGWNLILMPNRLIDYDICPKTMVLNGVTETVHVLTYYAFPNKDVDMMECCN